MQRVGSSYDGSSWGGLGGTPNGVNGAKNSYATTATAGFTLSFTKTSGSYGSGGKTDGARGGAGGSGGYDSQYVDVTSGALISISVGAGGSAGFDSRNSATSDPGTSGFVLIAYGGDI